MSGIVDYECREQTTKLYEKGKVVFKWTIQNIEKFQAILAEFRSPSFAIKYGPLSLEKFHLTIECQKPEPEKTVGLGFSYSSSLCKIAVGIVKETDGKAWSKIRLDRSPLGSVSKDEKLENLVADANHILESGCNKNLVESTFRSESESKIELILTMTLVQSGLENPANPVCPIQNVSGITKWKEIGKINFKWTIEDYKAQQVFQRWVRSETLTVECEDGTTEVFHFEATLPSKNDTMKLILVKKSDGEAWVDIGVTGATYVRTGSVYKSLKVIDEGKNEDVFKCLDRVSARFKDLDFHVEIIFCKSSYELID